MILQKWWIKCKKTTALFNASDWSRLLSPWRLKTFPAMCGSLSDTRALVHIEQPLCTACMVPGLLTLKPCSCFFLGTFKCSQTSLQMWAQMMFFYLQSLGAASSACFTMPWKKCEQSIFSAASKWECRLLAAGSFFENHRLPSCCSNNKLNFQDLPETLLLSTNTERGLKLDTYHSPPLYKSHIPELLKTPGPWISPCFHSNWSGATLFRCGIQSTSALQ